MSTIACEMFDASLGQPPQYVAISYAWGDPEDTQSITIAGAVVVVTASLHGALNALRDERESVTVWADALCIDQDNLQERSHQVKEMARIYANATSVAVWLGPEADKSVVATRLIESIADSFNQQDYLRNVIQSRREEVAALVSLFERPYWKRLWVVQEVYNAAEIVVYCGSSKLSWDKYRTASAAFQKRREFVPRDVTSATQLPFSDVLAWHGPSSFPGGAEARSLLEALRTCREKLSTDPRDKVFGVLGILPANARSEFLPDYRLSVKEVYTNVVDYLLHTTHRFDVVCEASHAMDMMPSWVPDWSHAPQTSCLGLSYNFDAAPGTRVSFSFPGPRRTKLKVSAIYLDLITARGMAVGTLCNRDDFLMAFIHWRAVLAKRVFPGKKKYDTREAFCRALCVGQTPQKYDRNWGDVCYHAFSALLRERLPSIPLDDELLACAVAETNLDPQSRSKILRDICGKRMMGRCLCITEEGLIGVGSGRMAPRDVVVIPLGCYTPVILRPERHNEYSFIGDVYVDGYMSGLAMEELEKKQRQVRDYVIR